MFGSFVERPTAYRLSASFSSVAFGSGNRMRDLLRASPISFHRTFTWRKVGAVVITSDSRQRASAHKATAPALNVFPEAWQDLMAVRGFLAAEVRISCCTRHGFC